MCFQNYGKTAKAAKFIKSNIMTKVIDSILYIDTFEQQFVVLKIMLQSPRLEYHVRTIGIDQSFSNNSLFEHKCLEKSINYTNVMVSVTTSNNSKIFLRLLWFLLLKYSPITVPDIP